MSNTPNTNTSPLMVPVRSGTIRAIGYDEFSSTLMIQFTAGLYVYDDVPADVHKAFMKADSKGKYFAAHIRGKFEFVRLPNPVLHEIAKPLAVAS